jgi:hypothetical protein
MAEAAIYNPKMDWESRFAAPAANQQPNLSDWL